MKIALAQLNYHIGNFTKNTEKILNAIQKAKENKADLIVFSELAICGYPPLDLLEREEFVQQCIEHIEQIAKSCIGIAAIVGGPCINPEDNGKNLFNSAYFLNDGKIEAIQHKTLLPNYDIFDEYRYFEPNTKYQIIPFKGKKLAIIICEDLWDEQPVVNSFAKSKLYKKSPIREVMSLEPDLLINIAASPFSYNHEEIRRQIIGTKAKDNNIPIVYVNQIGANTELVFDGGSIVVNNNGETIKKLAYFTEDIQFCDIDNIKESPIIKSPKYDKIALIYDALVLGVRDYFNKTGFTKATLGLSGGLDSALTLAIATEALGADNMRVLLLPSKYSSDHSIKDAEALANNLNVKYDIIPIKDIVNEYDNTLEGIFKGHDVNVAEENIQARIRGTLLMGLSNKFGYVLLNTSNKSEAAVGYSTLYGDMNGGLSVLGDVYKTDVFSLARYVNRDKEIIPINTITKAPSAELRPDQKDSDSLPDYSILDKILFKYIEKNESPEKIIAHGFNKDTVLKMVNMVNKTEYKRFQTPPIIRVSSKAFGLGRRIPLVSKI